MTPSSTHTPRALDVKDLPAVAYELGEGIRIEAARQIDGSVLWAVRQGLNVLSKEGEWEYEPMPSSRDAAFLAQYRYATPQEALDTVNRYL